MNGTLVSIALGLAPLTEPALMVISGATLLVIASLLRRLSVRS